ncbi:MAG: hypothetical protein EBT15_12175 [Betaproteobacteria bacterium]|nr:hypothetical protein [Betaproteobacteria bacterium]
MSVKRFSRLLDSLNYGNKLLRDVYKSCPTAMNHSIQQCLNHYEAVTLMAKESLEKAKQHKKKALEGRL